MKALASPLATHYAEPTTTLCTIWRLTRSDGVTFGFTDHDRTITYDSLDYVPSSAYDLSDNKTSSELNVDNLEAKGVLDDSGITAADVEAGLWDNAEAWVAELNWADPTMGANVLRVGRIGNIQRTRLGFVAEHRGLMQTLQNNLLRVVLPTCDAVLGDARCGVNLAALTVSGAVTSVTSNRAFVASALAQAAGYFNFGVITFTSGDCDGLAMEVKTHATGGDLTLQLAMPRTVTIGDTFTLSPGCDKTPAVCKATFSNFVNFRGFDQVPGQTRVLKYGGQ